MLNCREARFSGSQEAVAFVTDGNQGRFAVLTFCYHKYTKSEVLLVVTVGKDGMDRSSTLPT